MCRHCAWPLNREAMIGRLLAERAEVKAVLLVERDGAGTRKLTGGAAQAAVDALARQTDAVIPVCEAAGMVAFRRAAVIEFFLFEDASAQSALAAMAGR